MATCPECGTEISNPAETTCEDCQQAYCSEHHHDHQCPPNELPVSEPHGDDAAASGPGFFTKIGYGVAAISGLIGLIYFFSSFNVILGPGEVRDVLRVVIGGSFFSFGTFILVAAYIHEH